MNRNHLIFLNPGCLNSAMSHMASFDVLSVAHLNAGCRLIPSVTLHVSCRAPEWRHGIGWLWSVSGFTDAPSVSCNLCERLNIWAKRQHKASFTLFRFADIFLLSDTSQYFSSVNLEKTWALIHYWCRLYNWCYRSRRDHLCICYLRLTALRPQIYWDHRRIMHCPTSTSEEYWPEMGWNSLNY